MARKSPPCLSNVDTRKCSGNSIGAVKPKTSKITGGCLSNARSRRLVSKFATDVGNSANTRGKRPGPRGPGQLRQRESDSVFEFDAVYSSIADDETSPRLQTENEEFTILSTSELTYEYDPPSPPRLSPPHSPIPPTPDGLPPNGDSHDPNSGYYRKGPITYNTQKIPPDTPEHRPYRISHRRQPYRGHGMNGQAKGGERDGAAVYSSGTTGATHKGENIGEHRGVHKERQRSCNRHDIATASSVTSGALSPAPVTIHTPVTAEQYTMSLPTQQSVNQKRYMRGGPQVNILALDSRRPGRNRTATGNSPQESSSKATTPDGGGSYQFEIDPETFKKLQRHAADRVKDIEGCDFEEASNLMESTSSPISMSAMEMVDSGQS